MRLLLINPRFPESFWSYEWMLNAILPGQRSINPPLGLATLAALCPAHWEVEIVDENIEPIPLLPEADIIGLCGMGVQFQRQKELLSYYRARGTTSLRVAATPRCAPSNMSSSLTAWWLVRRSTFGRSSAMTSSKARLSLCTTRQVRSS